MEFEKISVDEAVGSFICIPFSKERKLNDTPHELITIGNSQPTLVIADYYLDVIPKPDNTTVVNNLISYEIHSKTTQHIQNTPPAQSYEQPKIQSSHALQQANTELIPKCEVENLPLSYIAGIDDKIALPLEKHAFIFTVGDLANFPQNWPGIFTLLKESGLVPKLDFYIETAKQFISSNSFSLQ